MYLQRVELQGFKSFAQKTVFEFLAPKKNSRGVTAIVGPNGSGKSNLADGLRWVLGEQSMKLLRGKKSEDVIFAGSDKKARLGFAEVALTLVNENARSPRPGEELEWLDLPEIVITRRLYRDGEGEYLINGAKARLSDIQLLLAKAHFGQKTYTVIGQGMIDQILLASAKERKEFFDEAAGVKEFQLKRHQAMLKLHATRENIAQAESIVREIEPRVRTLSRAVKRLEERGAVEEKLRIWQSAYYGNEWHDFFTRSAQAHRAMKTDDEALRELRASYEKSLASLRQLEQEETQSELIIGLQRQYEQHMQQRQDLKEEELRLQTALEVHRVRAETREAWSPLSLSKIIEELENLRGLQKNINQKLRAAGSLAEVHKILDEVDAIVNHTEQLLQRLQRPAPEAPVEVKPDAKVMMQIEEIRKSLFLIDNKAKDLSEQMHAESHREQEKKSRFFAVQRVLQDEQRRIHEVEQRVNNFKVELARLETRLESLREEMRLEIPEMMEEVLRATPPERLATPIEAQREIYSLKHQLEMIGGIDPEVVAEYEETQTRFTFLTKQLQDLAAAMINTENTIKEFDDILKTRREEALETLNECFQEFFARLFGGGVAKLVPVYTDPRELAEADDTETEEDVEEEAEQNELASSEPILSGIEIQATPPGKRIKDITVLSGGERAMTSVALLCAIMASNPSPFVVLDEVDAALDEANSQRFAEILQQLSEKTQFIVVTHNRATMAKGDILYGVTMGDDGISQLLSVHLDEAKRWAK